MSCVKGGAGVWLRGTNGNTINFFPGVVRYGDSGLPRPQSNTSQKNAVPEFLRHGIDSGNGK